MKQDFIERCLERILADVGSEQIRNLLTQLVEGNIDVTTVIVSATLFVPYYCSFSDLFRVLGD